MRRISVFASLLLMAFLFCACSDILFPFNPPDTPSESDSPTPETSVDQTEQETTEVSQTAADNGTSDSQPDVSAPVTGEADAKAYLVGSWRCYSPDAHADIMWLDINEDGSYSITVDSGAGLWGYNTESVKYSYTGNWNVEPWEDSEYPYMLRLALTETNDSMFQDYSGLGDFLFREISLCDGDLMMELVQLNNGDGLYTRFFMYTQLWVLERTDDRPLTQSVRKDAVFYGHIWKMLYGPDSCIFVDDVTLNPDGSMINDIRESVRYLLSGKDTENISILTGGPDGILSHGNDVYEFITNAEGEIISARYIPTVYTDLDNDFGPLLQNAYQKVADPLTEDGAGMILRSIDDVQPYLDAGMSILFDGKGKLSDDETSSDYIFLTLGTDNAEQFIREIKYAVAEDGLVYRYDAVTDQWNIAD